MTTTRIPGGWYADAAPGGKYAALVAGSHLETDEGRVDLPGENVLYLRAQWANGRRDFAGSGHNTDQGWWFKNGQWARHGVVRGVSPAAFEANAALFCRGGDRCDRLHFDGLSEINFPLVTGSQGIRWVGPSGPVSSDSSYADPIRGLFQYTDYGDVAFGEADDGAGGGCVVRFADDGILRRVEPGQIRFVRVQRSGDQIALAMSRQDTVESVVIWTTLAELRQAEPVAVSPPPEVVVPPAPAHLKGCGYFYRDTSFHAFLKYWGDENHEAPGTHSIILEDYALPAESRADGSKPRMIIGMGQIIFHQIPQWWDQVDAIYVPLETSDQAALNRLADFARMLMRERGLPQKPILSYTAQHVLPDALEPDDILGVQFYAPAGEGPDYFRRLAAEVWPKVKDRKRVAIIAQAYDRLGWFNGPQLAAMQPVLYDIACQWPNCELLLWFSDSRKGGTRDHEEMRPYHLAIWNAITRRTP